MAETEKDQEKFIEENPQIKDFLPFLDVQNKESPRGAVLVACSFLDELLRKIIDAFLIEDSDRNLLLDTFNAPIGTFSARIKIAHCLGLISDEERNDCDILRKIRNEYAHNHRTSFEDKNLIDLCKNLHHSAKSVYGKEVEIYGQFKTGAVGLLMNLINRPHYVKQKRIQKKIWHR